MFRRRRLIRTIFAGAMAGPTIPWYLAGGVSQANCVAAYRAQGASSLAASRVNLANPGTYNLVELSGTMTWDATNGWSQSTSAIVFTTGITGAVAGSWTWIIKFSGAENGKQPFGSVQAGERMSVTPNYSAASVRYYTVGAETVRTPHLTAGILAMAGMQPYRNGAADGAEISVTPTTVTDALYLMGSNDGTGGVSANFIDGYVQGFALYNTALSAAQVLAITTAMQNF